MPSRKESKKDRRQKHKMACRKGQEDQKEHKGADSTAQKDEKKSTGKQKQKDQEFQTGHKR